MPPKVSIVTPCYGDRTAYLPARIDSILNQTFQDFEWVLVDDGCVPASKAILQELERHPKVKAVIEHPQTLGVSRSYNDAVAQCEGEYVLRAEDDDTCQPDFIEKMVKVLDDANPNVGLAFSAYRLIDSRGSFLKYSWDEYTDQRHDILIHSWIRSGEQVFKDMLVLGNYVHGCTQMIRRVCFLKLGEYYPGFQLSADADFVNRLALNFDFAYLNDPLVFYRKHPGSYTTSKAAENTIIEYYLFLDRAMKRVENKFEFTSVLKEKALARYGRMSANHVISCFLERKPQRALSLIRVAANYDPKIYWHLGNEVFRLIKNRLMNGQDKCGHSDVR